MKFIATLNSLNNNLYLIGEKSDELDILYSLKYNFYESFDAKSSKMVTQLFTSTQPQHVINGLSALYRLII